METNNVKLNILKESPFKLIIPKKVEHKIRYHIRRFPSTEWSGFLFYNYEGSFETNDLVFTAVDFVVLNIGSGAQTSFDDCPKVCTYAIDHDLLDCKEALIHSHHSMGAFFSTTDDNAIKQEAMNCNHFLSLVVDTRGTYVARVTRRNIVKQTIHQTITEETCYPTYEDKIICNTESTEKTADFVKETSEVIVYPLNIQVEKWEEENVSEWEDDIKEARQMAVSQHPAVSSSNINPFSSNTQGQFPPYRTNFPLAQRVMEAEKQEIQEIQEKEAQKIEAPIFHEEDFEEPKVTIGNKEVVVSELSPQEASALIDSMYTEEDVKYLALQFVTANPFVLKDKCAAINQYIVKLPTIVKDRFSTPETYYAFIDSFVENLLEDFADANCMFPELMDDFISMVAMEIQTYLEGLPKNVFVNHISDQLNAFLI